MEGLKMDKLQYHEKGLDYLHGRGTEKNYVEAEKNFIEAAKQGVARSMFALYMLYANGAHGVPRNKELSIHWLNLAVEEKHPTAVFHLGTMNEKRIWSSKHIEYAARLYQEAATQGLGIAQNNLGLMYEKGRGGLQKDLFAALKYFSRAARQGDTLALENCKHVAQKLGMLTGESEFRCGVLAKLATEKPSLAEILVRKLKTEKKLDLTIFQTSKSPYPFYINRIITSIVTAVEETLFPESAFAYKDESYLNVYLFCAMGTGGHESIKSAQLTPFTYPINDNNTAIVLYADNIKAICHAMEMLSDPLNAVLVEVFNSEFSQLFYVRAMNFAADFLVLHEHMHHRLLHNYKNELNEYVSVEKDITQELAADLNAAKDILTSILLSGDPGVEKEFDALAFLLGVILVFLTMPQPENDPFFESFCPEHAQRIHFILVAFQDICQGLMPRVGLCFDDGVFDIIGTVFGILLYLPHQNFQASPDSDITPSEIEMFRANAVKLAKSVLNDWESTTYNDEIFRDYLKAIADDSQIAGLDIGSETLVETNASRFQQMSANIISRVITQMKAAQI